ncbi:ABC transporter permease [Sphingomonas sp. AP4-R1]|uniref:ABC transporter permease n=1 Tax=Sphingomonas sp. AP4-R1 TaxID=2735134 RepID=UPI0014937BDA|nr:ABC transporter permease [Sphingomonas sp. AP4-R1]QJU59018.1 ABC transporter permease [Sphingomonas sp. AP4-R1]
MSRLLRSAWVIARRDYVATVWSRTFLFFLLGPLVPLLFGGGYGAIMATQSSPRHSGQSVQLILSRADADAMIAARAVLAERLGETALPRLQRQAEKGEQPVLTGSLDAPTLSAPEDALPRLSGRIGLIVDRARAERAVGHALPPPVHITTRADVQAEQRDDSRLDLARGAQFVLFFLTMLLAGMMISNLVEEKSSKVIELLAAAVPVDAIFLGKLVGMLCVSLTGVAVWTSVGVVLAGFLPPQFALPAPAVGWPVFLALGIVYFGSVYLLIGALYLGVGAQAGSVREVQTLSMPLTMAQLLIFGLASAAVGKPDGAVAMLAAAVPWTSPFAMLARAAQFPALWPHLLALLWQVAALAVMVRIGARLFRRNVLKSGRGTSVKP